jgi:hypothetical protein
MLNKTTSVYSFGISAILLTLLLFGSCNLFKEKPNEVRSFFTDLESRSFPDHWIGTESIIEGSAHSGTHFSRINKQHALGISYQSELPNFIKTKNFALEVDFYYRMQDITSKALLTITLTLKDSLIFQESLSAESDSAVNRWALFKYKVNFPGNLPPNSLLSVTLRQQGKSDLDIDDYKISFNRIGRPTFLISDKKEENGSFLSSYSFRPIYKNKFYTILYSDKLGDLQVRSIKNDKIFTSLRYYIQWLNGKDTTFEYADKLIFTPGEKDEMIISGQTTISNFTLKLFANESSPLIKAESKTIFKDSVQLLRESLVLNFSPEISEVYRKNTLMDSKRIRNEYWLDKEGVKIGSQLTAAYIYHNPEISSLQLSSRLSLLIINLDYYRDHPLSVISHDSLQDISCNNYKSNATRENDFQLFAGFDVGSLPRFMKSPNGYLSSYVVTKESDCIDLQTKIGNGIGSGLPYVQSNYLNSSNPGANYYFYGHLIYPYPGFGDFFPTPNYWINATIANDIYSWRPNPYVNQGNNWDSVFTPKRLKDFITNRGIVFSNCKPAAHKENTDSATLAKASEKIQHKLPYLKSTRLVNFTTVKEIMEYWVALEKVKIRLQPDGKFRLYNSGLQDIKGLSIAIKADNVFVNGKLTENSYRDEQGDMIVWFDLRSLKSVIISVK